MKRTIMISAIACVSMIAAEVSLPDNLIQQYYKVNTVAVGGTKLLDKIVISGPAVPPVGITRTTANSNELEASEQSAEGSTSIHILKAPKYNWSFGCSATSASMIGAYYDRMGYPNIYTGPTNNGVMPMDNSVWPDWTDSSGDTRHQTPLSATHEGLDGRIGRGHVDDYWVAYGNTDDDPFVTNDWPEHSYDDCFADFMKTNQTTNYDNSDGATTVYAYESGDPLTAEEMESYNIQNNDGMYGMKLFYESKGYTVTTLYTQKIDAVADGGFTFEQYKKEIDAGHPVMIHLTGHTVVGVGYDADTNTVYLHDTWDYNVHTMTWGGSYAGMDQQSVSIVHLKSVSVKNDFNADGIADIVFRNSDTGENVVFFQSADGKRSDFAYTTKMSSRWQAAGIGDFDGNGISDILFRDPESGENVIFFQSADGRRASSAYTARMSGSWHVAGVADFNKDGIADILYRNQETGKNLISYQNPDGSRASYAYILSMSSSWHVAGTADFNKDGFTDILFRDQETGKNFISFQNTDDSVAPYAYTTSMSSSWHVAGTADFNKDGIADILFRNQETGKNLIFFQNEDGSRASYAYTSSLSSNWDVAEVADFNADGITDILFRNSSTGKNLIFFQNEDGSRASYAYTTAMSNDWHVVK